MKILFVSAVLPYPLDSGGQIRIYNLLKRLSRRHEITVVSYIRKSEERGYRANLNFCKQVYMVKRGYAWQPAYIFRSITSSYPFLMATYVSSPMRTLIERLMAKDSYQLIHLEPFYVRPAVPPHTTLPIVVSEHNIEYEVYSRFVDRFKFAFLRPFLSWDVGKLFAWERKIWRNADAVTAVSFEDARVIEKYLSHDITVVPNGVDPAQFRYQKPARPNKRRILFVGNFRWLPNREAAYELVRTIWPQVIVSYPGAHLTIIGRNVPVQLKKEIDSVGGKVYEDVQDIREAYHNADVLVAPHAIAGGTKYKMLEAMASGLPIVTSVSGMKGLAAEADEHYLEARTAGEYMKQISRLWENPALAERLSRNARALVESQFNWDHIAEALDRVWKGTPKYGRH